MSDWTFTALILGIGLLIAIYNWLHPGSGCDDMIRDCFAWAH